MKLLSEVVKKVETERKIPVTEETTPAFPEKKKKGIPLILKFGVFIILLGAGFLVWNFKFKNPATTLSQPKKNLGERLKKAKNKSLAQASAGQNLTQGDSTVKALAEIKIDSPGVSTPKVTQSSQVKEPKPEAQKLLSQPALGSNTVQKDSALQLSSKEKTDFKNDLVPFQKVEEKKKPLTEKYPSPPKEKKDDFKNLEPKDSQPDKLILSTPFSKTESEPAGSFSLKEKSQLVKNYFDFGLESQSEGKYKEAEECYLKALSLDSNFYPARLNLSTIYLEKGRLSEAEKELNKLLSQKKEEPKVWYNLALIYYRKKDFVKAVEFIDRLLVSDSNNSKACLLKGKSLEAQNNLNEAIKTYMQAYQIDPNDPKILYSLGRAKDLAGEKYEALTYYQLFLNNSSEKDSDLIRSVSQRVNFLKSTGGKND